MDKRKSQRGSITLFVLITCMFFIIILLVINIGGISKNTSQEKELEEISKAYEVNETELDDTYKKVVDENEYATIGDVYEIVNEEITNLFPKEYIQPTPVDGVKVYDGGYVKIGNLVIVNMTISINTSEITISTDPNNLTTIATGLPKAKTRAILTGYYSAEGAENIFARAMDGDLRLATGSEKKYTSGFGILITGAYIIDE